MISRWLKRRFGLSIRCHLCRAICLRDTCQKCRDAIDKYWATRLGIAFPPATVTFEYIPMKWTDDTKWWVN